MSNRPTDDPCKIGIMHAAFRVGKVELVNWVNECLDLDYAKVEDCALAACYVQFLDCIYGKKYIKTKLKNTKWKNLDQTYRMHNWKLVQQIFIKENITKPIDISNLSRGKFQDNLEFLQWFKFFFLCLYKDNEYNAMKRRGEKGGSAKILPREVAGGLYVGAQPRAKVAPKKKKTKAKAVKKKKTPKSPKAAKTEQKGNLDDHIATLELTAENVEKERNFYFGKLREIEILCQEEKTCPAKTQTDAILKIMYKTDDDGGEGDAAEEDADEDAGEDGEEVEVSVEDEDEENTTF